MTHAKIDAVWDKYDDVARKNFCDLPMLVRPVITTYSAQGIIDNGGFAYFFECDWPGVDDWGIFAADFDAVGHTSGASAIRGALSLFPEGRPQRDIDRRRSHIFQTLGGPDGELGKLDGPICGKASVLTRLLECYIDTHELA